MKQHVETRVKRWGRREANTPLVFLKVAIERKASDGALGILQWLFLPELNPELQNKLYCILLNCPSPHILFLF